MAVYLQTLGFHDISIPPSLQLVTDFYRILFNVGENSQRLRMERNLHMSKIHSIFLTDLSISAISGLPGLLLAMDNSDAQSIDIVGPVGVNDIISTLSTSFMNLHNLKLNIKEVNTLNHIEVSKELEVICVPLQFDNKKPKLISNRIAYIVNPSQKPGTLDIDKATQLGIPKGPLLGQLKSGKSITLDDGTVINPEQVIGKPIVASQALIIKIENEHDLNVSKSVIPPCVDAKRLDFIFHLKRNDNYNEFGDALHIQLDNSRALPKYILFSWAERSALTLNSNKKIENDGEEADFPPLTIFNMYDKSKLLEQTREDRIDKSNCLEHISHLKPFSVNDLAENFKHNEGKYKLTMLGTGGCAPSPIRNVSSILLIYDKESSILLDCGEGTLYQLYLNSTTWDEFTSALSSIKAIVITHSHADHHMGILNLIIYRKSLLPSTEPISVIAPKKVSNWLQHFLRNEVEMPCKILDHSPIPVAPFDISLFRVVHIHDSMGIIVEVPNGFKVVYTGDTRPCPSTIEAARDCDVLIHEATFYHQDLNLAMEKKHSTINEVMEIAEKSNCKLLVLTHFSQRYSLPININTGSKYPKDKIVAALDFLTIHFD